MQHQAPKTKPIFIFEHKMIKEEIETLKHIYFDNITVNSSSFIWNKFHSIYR